MTTVIDDQFAANVTGWATIGAASAVAWNSGAAAGIAADGADQAGRMVVSSGDQAERVFPAAITSGITRFDFWFFVSGTVTGTSHDTFIYLDYASSGTALNSANSAATLTISRDTGVSASSTKVAVQYRNASGFLTLTTLLHRSTWHRLSVVVNEATHTYDLYLNDILWERGITCPNNAWTELTRIAVLSEANADDLYISNVLVTSDWAIGETVLIEHDFTTGQTGEIEATTPTTCGRQLNPQPWLVPADTSQYGGFLLGANGGTPDASRTCFALQRCLADGIVECEFRSSVAGVEYFGIMFRTWDYSNPNGAGHGLFRISGSNNTAVLFLPDSGGTVQTMQSTSLSPAANTVYTLRVEMRGRYVICSYKAAAMDAGSYTVAFTHKVTNSATGGRGMLSEELCGPFIATTTGLGATDNYCRKFRFTGAVPAEETTPTIGGYTVNVAPGSVRSLYVAGAALPTRDLFWSKGIQNGHRSRADAVAAFRQRTCINGTHVKAYRQRAQNMTEYQQLGTANMWVTLLRRGPHVYDSIVVHDSSENFAPDCDLRGDLWSTDFKWINSAGSISDESDATFGDWTNHGGSLSPTIGMQFLTAYGSGNEYLLNQCLSAIENVSGSVWSVQSRWEGNGDPISRVFVLASVSVGTEYSLRRSVLLRQSAAISGEQLSDFRSDISSPATLTFTSGSLKTDAAGDENADGYNERHGWQEITCSGGAAHWSIDVPTDVTRYGLAFRLWGWIDTFTLLEINGSPAVEGTDFVFDNLGDGTMILQLLGDITADTELQLLSSETGNRRRRLLLCGSKA